MTKHEQNRATDRLAELGAIVAELQFGTGPADPVEVARAVVQEVAISLLQLRELVDLDAELERLRSAHGVLATV
ncbi:hypothetical protein [Agromyces humi]|uniref:hypothetical protein n=1 Tax=Agromyces humi TaxID=1766800 RepID=UPI00135A53F2|nr:hypothetical protein [Agromyces humi]